MSYLIKNALVIDGSGAPGKKVDVQITGDYISDIGSELPCRGRVEVIDAEGMVLAPGFIDAHSHSDMSILAAPEAEGKISQGITTEVIGNCGLSLFPVTDNNRAHLEDVYRNYGQKITWQTFIEYAAKIQSCSPAVNIASLVGHNTLRSAAAGYDNTVLSQSQTAVMNQLLLNTLASGAAGVSTGLLYVPGKFADKDEIVNILKSTSKFNLQYATHLRSEGNKLIEAIDEAVDVCRAAGQQKLHISHFKVAGSGNWCKIDAAAALIQRSQSDRLRITVDCYPYTEAMTQLSVIAPPPFDDMDDSALMHTLADSKKFKQLRDYFNQLPASRWDTIRMVNTNCSHLLPYRGLTFSEIEKIVKITAGQLAAELLRDDAVNASAAFMGMSQEIVNYIAALPYSVCGTDESARPQDYSIGRSHPRGFGSVPRFFNLISALLPLESVIYKLTGLPASIFNLHRRGFIAVDAYADLVLFSPYKLSSGADFSVPHRLAAGIHSVWVNGKMSYREQQVLPQRHGRFLKINCPC